MNYLNVTAIAAAVGLIFSTGTIAQIMSEEAYKAAEEKGDELSGNDKDVCVKEAKAVETRMKADAEAQMTTSDAKTEADKTSTVAGGMEQAAKREASQESLTETQGVYYAVAKEKCTTLESGDQQRCKDEAKEQYSK